MQVNGLKQLPEAALASCHLAQLVRADLGSGRLAGKRTQLGLSVNKNNGIDYVVSIDRHGVYARHVCCMRAACALHVHCMYTAHAPHLHSTCTCTACAL